MNFLQVISLIIPEGKVISITERSTGRVIWKRKSGEQLTAPTISLDGDILTMTATDDRTEEFVIFVDGVEVATVAVDTVTISGTWVFNDTKLNGIIGDYALSFVSNGISYNRLCVIQNQHLLELYYCDTNVQTLVGIQGFDVDVFVVWQNEAYRTITFDGVQTVSKEFYDWLVTHATQTHCLLHAGTYVWKGKPNDDYNYDIYGEFVSNGQTFTRIHGEMDVMGSLSYYKSDGSSVRVYHVDSGWANTAYKTMVFTNNVLVEKDIFDIFMTDVMIMV